MPKIAISDAALFCAAALFTSSEQTRPYLHGVYVEPANGGGVLLTATDGAKLIDKANASFLRKAGWTVGKPATYATCSTKLANGNRLEATITADGRFYLDMHNDGPSYNVATGSDGGRTAENAACICVSMMLDIRAGAPVAEAYRRYMMLVEA